MHLAGKYPRHPDYTHSWDIQAPLSGAEICWLTCGSPVLASFPAMKHAAPLSTRTDLLPLAGLSMVSAVDQSSLKPPLVLPPAEPVKDG